MRRWVGKEKGRETIDNFFNEAFSNYQKNKIKFVSCDVSRAYIGAIEDNYPNAVLALDRFHIVKTLNKAIDEVRKEQWRNAASKNRKSLKGLQLLLFKHSSNRSKRDSRIHNTHHKGNRRIYRAWVLKDELEHFREYKSTTAAKKFLKGWITADLKSSLERIRKFVQTIRNRILPFIKTRLANAKAEKINKIIKIIKNRASGFRSLSAFTYMISLALGDLDIPAQIPAKFRSI